MKIPKAKQLPSGAWNCRLRVDGRDISITRPTEKEAVAEALAVKAGIKEALKTPKKQTLRQAIDAYIEARENVLSPSTIRGYKIIRDNRFPSMMHRDVHTVTQEQWQRAVNLEAKAVSAKTLTNSWRFIGSVLAEATGTRPNIRLPQIVPNPHEWLTPEQIPVFVEAIRGTKVEIAALLALSSLRCSELLALRWKDVDLQKGTLRVNGAAVLNYEGELVRKDTTKNKTSRRTVPIIPPLLEVLSSSNRYSERVVTMTKSGIYKAVNRICAANDLPEVGIHGLRHSFASLAYHLGLPEKITMELGGWSDDQTMRKIYTHLAKQDIDTSTKAFTNFFNPKQKDTA